MSFDAISRWVRRQVSYTLGENTHGYDEKVLHSNVSIIQLEISSTQPRIHLRSNVQYGEDVCAADLARVGGYRQLS